MAKLRHELRRKRDQIELALYTGAPVAGDEVRRALEVLAVEVGPDEARRVDELATVAEGKLGRDDYRDRHGVAGVRRFATAGGATIYLMAVETFPDHVNNVYLIRDGARVTLYDCGSQTESSRQDLSRAQTVLAKIYDEPRGLDDVADVVVSHAHIDHFGGVADLKVRTRARLCVHELDARVLACFEERVIIASKDVEVFLCRAGVSAEERDRMLGLYMGSRDWFKSVEVDRALRDGDLVGNGHRVIHTPGHCPGEICLQVGDVLLTGDHVLARITPHQFPQAITPFGGLEHYFHSLAKVRKLELVNLALAGHEEPIHDFRKRVDEIATFHRERLLKVREICALPRTIAEVAAEMFGAQEGYGSILAIEEAGAHVEYLHALGKLSIENLDEVKRARDPVFRYIRR
jgi:glyoxylase-like metal-dependent hydrolase (beta-lactamase superfamily II)